MKEHRLLGYNSNPASGVGSTVEVSEIESLSKGALIAGDGSGAPTTLSVGSNDLPLVADSAQTAGLKYAVLPIAGGGTGAASASAAFTALKQAASDTATGVVELAIASELDTGTDATRAVTPDALAGSNMGERVLEAVVFDFATNVATGDGKFYFTVPSFMDGMDLVAVHARVITAGTTGTTDIQIANVTDAVDMLSTKLTIDSAETGSDTAATAAVINGTNDNVSTNDLLRIDVDAVSTTPPQGLIVRLEFRLP